jgi:acyl-coenzyme A synthetase/AMP-(fatty) acid ligase
VVVLAEVRGRQASDNLDAEIRRLVTDASGLAVHDVVLLPPGSIPKTTSGKVQRGKTRGHYLRGHYHRAEAERERAALAL